MSKEVMRQALEALENSVDLVREDAYQAEKLYGNYPTRQGKVAGLKVLADDHEKAISALREALEQPAQKCSYPYCGCNSKAWCKVERNEALDKKAENARELGLDYEPAQQEPVAYAVYHRMGGGKSLHWFEQHSPDGDASEYQLVPLYTSPPAQRKPLTDEEIEKCYETTGHYQTLRPQDRFAVFALARAIEAKLKENT